MAFRIMPAYQMRKVKRSFLAINFGTTGRLFLLLLLWCPLLSWAQSFSFQQYGVEDGLAQSNVNHVIQDQFGNLWLGTSGGLSRFNGYDFTNFYIQDGLKNLNINYISKDHHHNILVATSNGLSIYNGKSFTFFSFKGKNNLAQPIKKAFEDQQGNVWVLTYNNQVGRLQGDSIENYFPYEKLYGEHITDIAEDATATIWFCTREGSLFRYHHQTFEKVTTEGLENFTFYDIYIDSKNTIWLITDQGLVQYDEKSGTTALHTIKNEDSMTITSLAEDGDNYLWIGTSNGTFKYQVATRKILPNTLSLSNSVIQSIFKDREGNMWFGTFGEGLYKFKGETFSKLRKEEGLSSNIVFSILKDHADHYWLGHLPGGIDRYDGKNIKHYGRKDGLSSELVLCSVEDKDRNIWFGTFDGLNVFDGKKFTSYGVEHGLPNKQVVSAFKDNEETLWFGTKGGLVVFNNKKFQIIRQSDGTAFTDHVLAIKQLHDGRIIFHTNENFYVVEDGTIQKFLDANRLAGLKIQAFEIDENDNIWWATDDSQIIKYDSSENTVIFLNKGNNIPRMQIFSMVMAGENSLMIGTESGINCLKFDNNNKLINIKHYGNSEGFLGAETNSGAVFTEEDGSIWFGTVKGAYKYNSEKDSKNQIPPLTHLTGIKLFYEDVDWTSIADSVINWYNLPANLSLPYNQNHLIFEFNGSSLRNPEAVRYQFILENFDNVWSPVTDRREAVYANLPPGQYRFRVKACNSDGVWNLNPAQFSFTITPPFWRTWWFYSLAAVALIASVRLIILYRIKQEKERNKYLEREVKERTKEIQLLNSGLEQRVKERTAELELSNKKFEVEFELRKIDQENLARKEREYRELVNNLKEVIFKTDIHGNFTFLNDQWEKFTGYKPVHSLGRHFSDYLHSDDIAYNLHQFNDLLSRKIPYLEVEIRHLKSDGTLSWAIISAHLDFNDAGTKAIGAYGSVVDIDQRKKAEFALKASEEKYKFLAENTQDIISLHDREMKYLYVSPRIKEVAGLEPVDLLGKSKTRFIHPEDVEIHNKHWQRVIASEESESEIYRLEHKTGEYHWYETFHRPIVDEDGMVNAIISSSRDITEKVKLTQEVEEVRKKVARDFHDEMGNNLASISVLSQLIQTKLGDGKNGVAGLLVKIDTASRNLFNGTRDFIWAIDPKNDSLKEVFFNLKDFGEELLDNTGIKFYSEFDNYAEHNVKLPSGWSRQIVLIFKEGFTNLLKYSKAHHVHLTFNLDHTGLFEICLEDDGVGFDIACKEKASRGINNMKARSDKIGVRLNIKSGKNKGTTIKINGKITQNGLEIS